MKIGIEAQRIFREKKHGMDIYALELIRKLQAIDKENQYYIFVKPGPDVCLQETDNFKIVEVKGYTYLDWEQFSLPKAIRKYPLDLMHCTSNTAPLFSSIPFVLTLHDIIYLSGNFGGGSLYQMLGHYYRKLVVPRVVRRASRVVTVSNFEAKTIEEYFPAIKDVSYIYNGIGERFINTLDPNRQRDISDKFTLPESYLLFLGNKATKKNMDGVLKAYDLYVQGASAPLPLVILESDRHTLEKKLAHLGIDLDLMNHINLPGYIPHQYLPYLYALAEIFLYPSLRESFGIPIIESMACGTPVITSNLSSMPEVGGKAAEYIDPYNVEELVRAIEGLLHDAPRRERMYRLGLKRAGEFSWEQTARDTIQVYLLSA